MLNHQFLQIRETAIPQPGDANPPYEAMVMIGYDHTRERYVVHWMDNFGGRFSETLGYGTRNGDQIDFVFEYSDGPFHNTFRWLPGERKWQWLLKSKDPFKGWIDFANLKLTNADDQRIGRR